MGLHALAEVKPDFTESENLVRAMVFAEHLGARIYIPHLSCRSGLNEVRAYRRRYPHVYVETCPHYLTHTMDSDLPGSVGKANPPLRAQDDVEALWEAIGDGTVDVIGSDHVPRKKQTKMTNIWKSSQGFPGTATILPVLLSEGYHKRGMSLVRIAELCGSRPADIFNISARKGRLVVGADADLTIVDLDLEREVRNEELLSYSDYTPYDGWDVERVARADDVPRRHGDARRHDRCPPRPRRLPVAPLCLKTRREQAVKRGTPTGTVAQLPFRSVACPPAPTNTETGCAR